MEKTAVSKRSLKERFFELAGKVILPVTIFSTFLSPQIANTANLNQKEKTPVSLILGARAGTNKNKTYGGELGLKYGRFALTGYFGSRQNMNLQSTEEELFEGIYFQGNEDLKDFSSAGISLEYHHPFSKKISGVIGIGGGLEKYTREIEENLIRREQGKESPLASNINSISEKESFGNVYIGSSFKITDWLKLNPIVGYEKNFGKGDLNGGGYIGLRMIFPFSRKNNR